LKFHFKNSFAVLPLSLACFDVEHASDYKNKLGATAYFMFISRLGSNDFNRWK